MTQNIFFIDFFLGSQIIYMKYQKLIFDSKLIDKRKRIITKCLIALSVIDV
jgi:hypothetical protein